MGTRKQLKVLAKNPGLKEDLVAEWTKSPELLEAYNVCAFKVSYFWSSLASRAGWIHVHQIAQPRFLDEPGQKLHSIGCVCVCM